jgi:hypothetical protein
MGFDLKGELYPALSCAKRLVQRLGQPRHRKTTHVLGKTG